MFYNSRPLDNIKTVWNVELGEDLKSEKPWKSIFARYFKEDSSQNEELFWKRPASSLLYREAGTRCNAALNSGIT